MLAHGGILAGQRWCAVNGIDRVIRWSTALAVVCVAAVAAVVSYEHASALVRENGESGWTGRLIPLTVDGLIYASSMVMLDSARRGERVPALARWLIPAGAGRDGRGEARPWSFEPSKGFRAEGLRGRLDRDRPRADGLDVQSVCAVGASDLGAALTEVATSLARPLAVPLPVSEMMKFVGLPIVGSVLPE
jgi:hypothetical protein